VRSGSCIVIEAPLRCHLRAGPTASVGNGDDATKRVFGDSTASNDMRISAAVVVAA
jgi:hypothetical protein